MKEFKEVPNFKEITFEYDHGYFAQRNPSIKIRINKNYISYQEIIRDFDGKIIKGPLWKAPTDPLMFDDLNKSVILALFGNFRFCCDGDGTLVTAITEEGKKIENYIQLSFYKNGLVHLADILKHMCYGLKLPGFLYDSSEEDEEYLKFEMMQRID